MTDCKFFICLVLNQSKPQKSLKSPPLKISRLDVLLKMLITELKAFSTILLERKAKNNKLTSSQMMGYFCLSFC